MPTNISLYPHIKQVKSTETIPIDIFLENIRGGLWQDMVLPIRAMKNKKDRQLAKLKVPLVTISGIFPIREDKECKLHSGFIAIDIDDLFGQSEQVKTLLSADPFIYACFNSISGTGLCCLFRIEAEKHREAFAGIASYLIGKYQLIVDPTSVNPSRARYVSFDPHIFINVDALTFKKYLPKEKKRKAAPTIFVQHEFDAIVKAMVDRNVSCVDDYRDWLKISFGLADNFGENGRHYFHSLSACSHKYDAEMCDKQYNHALNRVGKEPGGLKITVATIYYFAKQDGIPIYSETTRKVAAAASTLKKSGLDKKSIIANLEKFDNIAPTDSREIVEQAFDSTQSFDEDESIVNGVLTYLRHTFTLRHNEVTDRVENNGSVITNRKLNSMFIDCKKVFDPLTFQLFKQCVFSEYTPTYNPFMEWWEENKELPYNREIDRLWECFQTDDMEKLKEFGTRWLVGIISSIHWVHSPLLLVLCGEKHGTGKTQTFRRLLPREWRTPVDYYAESKLDSGKDSEIMMCRKLLIMDDEFDGKNKIEQRKLKAQSDKETISERVPYGEVSEDMRRLAVMCGTSQTLNILNDPTGNRRIIPVEVITVNHEDFNAIDKAALFAQLFRMYYTGFKWEVTGAEMERLNTKTDQFIDASLEFDLINKYYELPNRVQDGNPYTMTDIKQKIEAISGQKLNKNRIGQELKSIGFRKELKRVNGSPTLVYYCTEKIIGGLSSAVGSFKDLIEKDELPF